MKKLGKLSISPEKIMKNEELINLQGGYPGPCGGHGYWSYMCTYRVEPEAPLSGPGIVCAVWEMEDGCGALARHYPSMTDCTCSVM